MLASIALLAAAVTEIEMVPATSETAMDFTWLFLKMLFILGAVTILAVLILKYGIPRTSFYKRMSKGRLFRVITMQHVAPRKSLYLVEICNKFMLLGVTDHAITPVLELSKEEVAKIEEGQRN